MNFIPQIQNVYVLISSIVLKNGRMAEARYILSTEIDRPSGSTLSFLRVSLAT